MGDHWRQADKCGMDGLRVNRVGFGEVFCTGIMGK